MHRRFRTSTRQKTGVKLRTLLYAGTFCATLLFGLSFLVIQFFRNETGYAVQNPMVISTIDVAQDTTTVFRGTSSQVMLRINIKTKGLNHKLNLNELILSARGTSDLAYNIIENARLWTTGNDENFSASMQLGATLNKIPKGNFNLHVAHTLQNGDNYIWLTYDISNNPVNGKFITDAECIAIKIGTLEYESNIAAPPGYRRLSNNIPYFSSGNGDISSLQTWNTFRDGSGTVPANFDQANATFHIQAGHIMQNKLSACLPALLIEKNGVLKSSSGVKINHVEVLPGGTFIQEQQLTKPESVKLFKIRNGGNFVHANTGRIPGKVKLLEPASNIIMVSCSKTTFDDSISWGNLVIDARESESVDFGGGFRNIRGDLEVRSTGKTGYLYSNSSDTISIKGNMVINGGRIILGTGNIEVQLEIEKSFSLKKGWFSDNIKGRKSDGGLVIKAGSAIALIAGEFHLTSPRSSIIFDKSNTSWIQQEEAVVSLPDLNVYNGVELNIYGSQIGNIPEGRKMQIGHDASVNFRTAIINGNGGFILDDGATLSTAHRDGINSAGDSGCIRTAKRIFNSGANYVYSGNSTPQKSGVFITTPVEGNIRNLEILKSSVTDVLVLSQNFNVTGIFIHSRGNVNKNNFILKRENHREEAMVSTSQKEAAAF